MYLSLQESLCIRLLCIFFLKKLAFLFAFVDGIFVSRTNGVYFYIYRTGTVPVPMIFCEKIFLIILHSTDVRNYSIHLQTKMHSFLLEMKKYPKCINYFGALFIRLTASCT